MIDLMGKQSTSLNFNISDKTEVYFSCGITFKGRFFIYGGDRHSHAAIRDYRSQIAKVKGCSLETVGTLDFYFRARGCTNANNQILLCFGKTYSGDERRCHSSMRPKGPFTTTGRSIYAHKYTRIASSKCHLYLVCILN